MSGKFEKASCGIAVKNLLDSYETIWHDRAITPLSASECESHLKDQTTLVCSILPHLERLDEVNFAKSFKATQLDKIFTEERLSMKMDNFNLYRDSKKECDIVVYSTSRYTVLQPITEPGRDLGLEHGSKVSHLTIISHGQGPITFNELLPSTKAEVADLRFRLNVMRTAVKNLRDNVPISQCGIRVIEKAKAMGLNGSMGIRQFMATQMNSMSEDKMAAYVLNNSSDMNVDGMGMRVLNDLVDDVFSNVHLQPFMCIQPPEKATQLLSHIHCFMLDSVPELIDENYVNCETLLILKQDKLSAKARSC